MAAPGIKTSGFTLAKGRELTGDDFYEVRTIGDLTVGIVCDGVGSAAEGAAAAKRVAGYLLNNFKTRPLSWSIEKSIQTFISSINSILYRESIANYERPELVTTLALVVIEGNRLYGANVGDSRVYLRRDDRLSQLSHDHAMEEEGYENVLTQAIGISAEVSPYYFENILGRDDILLLCSDGLYNVLDNESLAAEIPFGAHSIVKTASRQSSDELPDDTTAVVIHIHEADEIAALKEQELIIPESLAAGDTIDGYLLIKPLVQNERTWHCERYGISYVIKFAPAEAAEDKTILDLFVKEAWNARRLKAGFFPKAVIPRNRTHRYYLMKMVEGVDLKTYLKKRPLGIDDTIGLAKMLLKMGQYLIRHDLVHGDIKPENIMVSERDGKHVFKVIDYGSITEVYSIDSRAGTPSYLAPERFSGVAISENTEIFAIGVTLYEALTRSFPYGEIEPFQNPDFKNARSPKKLNDKMPAWLESVILRAIAPESDRRYHNYSHMLYELENSDKVVPFFHKESSFIERNPLLWCRIGFVGMLLLNIYLIFR